MSYTDIILVVIIALCALYGMWRGIMNMLLSLAGFVVSVVLAYLFSAEVGAWLERFIAWRASARENLAFVGIILLANWVLQVVVWILEKTVGVVWRLPFVGLTNRLLGLAFGAALGIVAVSVVVAFLVAHEPGQWIVGRVGASQLIPVFASIGAALLPNISNIMELIGTLQEASEQLT